MSEKNQNQEFIYLKEGEDERQVIIEGGFRHPEKGHMFKIWSCDKKRPDINENVSAWDLSFGSPSIQDQAFKKHFEYGAVEAQNKDLKKGLELNGATTADQLIVFLNDLRIAVSGGKGPSNGNYLVDIKSMDECRSDFQGEVSFWVLSFQNVEIAEVIFKTIFGTELKVAQKRYKKEIKVVETIA